MREFEITRYYRYVVGEANNWRAFEVRIVLTFPDDWDADDVKRHVEREDLDIESVFVETLEEACSGKMGKTRNPKQDQNLIDLLGAVKGDSDWGKLKENVAEDLTETEKTSTGFEAAEKIDEVELAIDRVISDEEMIEEHYKQEDVATDIARSKRAMEWLPHDLPKVMEEPTVAAVGFWEWKSLRGKTGGLTRGMKERGRRIDTMEKTRLATEEEIRAKLIKTVIPEVIDKRARYPSFALKDNAKKGKPFKWRPPIEKG